MIDSDALPAWAFEIVSRLHRSRFAEIALIVQNASQRESAPRPLTQRLRQMQTRNLLYNAYSRLDRLLNDRRTSAFDLQGLDTLGLTCPRLPVTPKQGKFTDELPPEALAAIRDHRLDVLLRFGFRILKGGVLGVARHGVWSYHHGDNRRYRGGPAGFWEVMHGEPSTGCVLQQLSEELDNGRILGRLATRTVAASTRRNQDQLFWRLSDMMVAKLAELAERGQVDGEPPPAGAAALFDRRLYTVPDNREMAVLSLELGARGVVHLADRLRYTLEWRIGYRLDEEGPWTSFHRYRLLPNPDGVFRADRLPTRRDGRYYLFFEEFVYADRRGHIAVVEVDRKGVLGPAQVALARPYHLSYPSLFEWQGETYMVVEASRNRAVEAYRCQRFPDQWEFAQVLVADVDVGDPTLYEQDGTWYLFLAGRLRSQEDYDDLHLLTAASPLGPWRPHPRNPVKSDVHGSRPAGALFEMDGKLYRPAQDGAPSYGHGIIVNEVLSLGGPEGRFEERVAARIRPEWRPDLVGTHTLQRGPGITAIDALVRVPRLSPEGSGRPACACSGPSRRGPDGGPRRLEFGKNGGYPLRGCVPAGIRNTWTSSSL